MSIVKIYSALIFILLISSFTYSQNKNNEDKYSQVRIYLTSGGELKKLNDAGLLIDHAIRKPDYIDTWLSGHEILMLEKSGVAYQILINDWIQYYASLPKLTPNEMRSVIMNSKELYNVSHSIYGSMGGFLTYSQVVAKLDSMRIQYPNLISAKFSLGTTVESRQIWTVRVSTNPDSPGGRPEVWYHSLIHAREPESMEHMIFFMYWLLENFNIDPRATFILKNRELYFTPVLNPDGYVYNETIQPNGGGLWRKNRKNNSGSFGIDLNRNYGTYQFWNSSNNGSSTSPSSDTYRGTSPFSELETRAAMNFINARNIQAVLGSHTYGNYIIKPWAWQDPVPTPDDNKFNEYLTDMRTYNKYKTGTPSQTVGYMVRGGADDWYYNDSAHAPHRIIAVTPETGTTGFWPSQAEIVPLAESMLYTNQYLAMIGGAFVSHVSTSFDKQVYAAGESGILKVRFKNKGVMNAQNVKIQCTTPSYYLSLPVTFYSFPVINSFSSDSSEFSFTIPPAVPNNSAIPLEIKFLQNDSNIVFAATKYILTGNGITTLADSAENGLNKWSTNQGWGITTSLSHSPTRSFTDSPSGNYLDNANNSLTLNSPVNVNSYPVTYLSFWHRYNTEANYDICNVEVSSNNGSSWQLVSSYEGILSVWTQQIFDITSYADSSTQLKVRFTLKSDQGLTADGWYIDDIKLTNYHPLINSISTVLTLTIAPEGFYNPASNTLSMRDTFTVYLREINSPFAIIDSARSVTDTLTLTGTFVFKNAPSGIYYIVVKHRNTIETWSKAGGENYIFGGMLSYNFTSSLSQAYGNNLKLKGTKYCTYSGDINQDGIIDAGDLSLADNAVFVSLTGYIAQDVSGDMFVDASDLSIIDNNLGISVQDPILIQRSSKLNTILKD